MVKFRGIKECPKCLHKRWVGEEGEGGIERVTVRYVRAVPAMKEADVVSECLEVSCDRCGYTWQEGCADATS